MNSAITMASRSLIAIAMIMLSTLSNGSFAEAFAAEISESLSDGQSLYRAMIEWKQNFSTWVGDDPCHWDGVLCNNDHRVVYLNLSNKGVQGPIPKEIGNLIYLETLDLNNPRTAKPPLNQVTGDLSALENLTNLQSLNLSFNNVQLPSFPTAVLNLKNLRHLRLDNNYIHGQIPKELGEFTQLKYLYLGNNTMTGPLPVEYSNLVNLIEMSLWNNNMNSEIPPEFGKLVNLEYLNLHDCNLYGGLPAELGNLVKLKNISLFRNALTGPVPDNWRNLTNLYNLFLHGNYLTKQFPTWIIKLPMIYNVSLDLNYFYGSLPSFEGSEVKIVTVNCNFFTSLPPTPPPQFNSSGNCFNNYDDPTKINCRQQPYFNCESFLATVPHGNCPDCPLAQHIQDPQTCVCTLNQAGGSKVKIIVGSVIGVVNFVCLLSLAWWMWARNQKSSLQPSSRYHGRYYEAQGSISEFWDGPEGVVRYNLEDLARATNDFSSQHEIGMGGFGKVFHAVLEGRDVAIKRAHLSSIQSSSGFRNEVLLLSRLHHKNLVHLLGFCEDDGIQILVYEYMKNGNLHTLLFNNRVILDWLKRLDIAIGVAQGLEYLHSFADPPVIHRDIKPSNILLDDNWVAKVSDFGISRVAPESETHFATRPAGTVGYIDPQYVLREELTTASDVYSFGMVLLELISGQKSIDNTRTEERNLVEWVKLKVDSDGLAHIVDPRLEGQFPSQIYEDIVRVAIDCASFRSEDRPSMKAVLTILNACRWSVSPHLSELQNNMQADLQEQDSEEDVNKLEKQGLAKNLDRSITVGSNNTFSVTILLPR